MANTRKTATTSNEPGTVHTEFEGVDGRTWTLPPLDPEAGNRVAGRIARDAIMQPDDGAAQARLGLATVEAALGSDAPELAALYDLPLGDMMDVIQRWLGEAGADQGKSGRSSD